MSGKSVIGHKCVGINLSVNTFATVSSDLSGIGYTSGSKVCSLI